MCQVDTCCGCCSLETGVIVQASIDITLACINFFFVGPVVLVFYVETKDCALGLFSLLAIVFLWTMGIRGGVLLGGALAKNAPLVMTGVVMTVIQLVISIVFCPLFFVLCGPISGGVWTVCLVLHIAIVVYSLVVLIAYHGKLKSGVSDAPQRTGVVYSVPGSPSNYGAPQPPPPTPPPPGYPHYPKWGNNPSNYRTPQQPPPPPPPPGYPSYPRWGNNPSNYGAPQQPPPPPGNPQRA